VSGARAIVEASRGGAHIDMSQGSHFFHNLISFRVYYFSVAPGGAGDVDWAWLEGLQAAAETERVRHVRLQSPLTVKVDGRTKRGIIRTS
jgi:hypothetical protein